MRTLVVCVWLLCLGLFCAMVWFVLLEPRPPTRRRRLARINRWKNVVAFALNTSDPEYTYGALEHAIRGATNYNGWRYRFYVGTRVPDRFIRALRQFKHVEVEPVSEFGPDGKTVDLWPMKALFDLSTRVAVFRDCRARYTDKEGAAVASWARTNYTYHVMHEDADHSPPEWPVTPFGWGCKVYQIESTVLDRLRERWLTQIKKPMLSSAGHPLFLKKHVAPLIRHDTLVHRNFPDKDIASSEPYASKHASQRIGERFSKTPMAHAYFMESVA